MSLKDTWINKIDNVDDVVANDINSIAEAVINLEEESKTNKTPLVVNVWKDGDDIVSELSDLDNIMHASLVAHRPIIVYEWDSSYMMYVNYAYTMTSGELGLYKFSAVKDSNLIELSGNGNGSGGVDWTKITKTLEVTDNKATFISETSTDTQYPTAKAVFDYVGNIETALDSIIAIQNELIGGETV